MTSTARVNASSTSIFRNQGDAILALPSVGILCAQLLLSVRRPFGSQSPARALCVRRSFNLGDLQAAFHRDCRCAEPRFPRWRLFPAVFFNSQLVASPARLTPSPRQLIYEPILHHLNRPFKRFQGVLGAPAGNRACPAPLRARSPQRPCHHHATMHATPISPRALAFAFMGMWHLVGCK